MLRRETRLTPFLRSLALILSFLLAGAALAAEAVFPPGSRIGLAPLAGMAPSKRFTGFEDAGQGVAFTFVEMPSEAYRDIASGLTAERLKDQGSSRERAVDEVRSARRPLVHNQPCRFAQISNSTDMNAMADTATASSNG